MRTGLQAAGKFTQQLAHQTIAARAFASYASYFPQHESVKGDPNQEVVAHIVLPENVARPLRAKVEGHFAEILSRYPAKVRFSENTPSDRDMARAGALVGALLSQAPSRQRDEGLNTIARYRRGDVPALLVTGIDLPDMSEGLQQLKATEPHRTRNAIYSLPGTQSAMAIFAGLQHSLLGLEIAHTMGARCFYPMGLDPKIKHITALSYPKGFGWHTDDVATYPANGRGIVPIIELGCAFSETQVETGLMPAIRPFMALSKEHQQQLSTEEFCVVQSGTSANGGLTSGHEYYTETFRIFTPREARSPLVRFHDASEASGMQLVYPQKVAGAYEALVQTLPTIEHVTVTLQKGGLLVFNNKELLHNRSSVDPQTEKDLESNKHGKYTRTVFRSDVQHRQNFAAGRG